MQEKARQCQTMEELNALLAENDVELSDDALQAVAGGCGSADTHTTHEFSFEEGTFSTEFVGQVSLHRLPGDRVFLHKVQHREI